ncbi:hypothetical protein HZC30_06490 [Candidatus Woesearchaeota archaeon]|nr:hypothetical protein [Candidatus Woesearchaeota archaeon]
MMMEQFYNQFPDIAEKETRCIHIMSEEEGLPKGEYFLLESYCNDPKCDCRRVFINILYKDKILATIGYGWESIAFYEKWMGELRFASDAKGPILELTGPHTEYSEMLLKLFKEVILKDNLYIDRLKKHYKMFKKHSSKKRSDKEEMEEELENFDPESHTIINLCKEDGTGIDAITDTNREAFYPIIMAIEETIWKHYLEDSSLKDLEIIESLKNLRDKIFSEDANFNQLEEEIVTKLKLVLFLNNYDRRDLSLSISSVLKSAKLHKSLHGSTGYLDFISSFFNQMVREK